MSGNEVIVKCFSRDACTRTHAGFLIKTNMSLEINQAECLSSSCTGRRLKIISRPTSFSLHNKDVAICYLMLHECAGDSVSTHNIHVSTHVFAYSKHVFLGVYDIKKAQLRGTFCK